jgi:glyoxylase-like metal-dependent hydrolase (beta-lactamase superfamily II)
VDVLKDYTGHTDPGGAAIRRDLDALSISKLSVGPMDNNAYLLVCRASNEALLIDAANEPERLADLVGAGDSRPELRHVVTTHRHHDHWQALGAVAGMFETRQIAHPLDAPELPIPADELVEQGDTVRFGEIELGVVHLRGHTPGSIALVYRDGAGTHIFTGDSLFPGGPGRTTSPEDFASLMDDLEERVFGTLPDETWVYPGHGDDTTLGVERPSLAEWRERGW